MGDGASSAEANPAHTYANAGTFQATLTVPDDAGAGTSDAVTITVAQAGREELHVEDQSASREKRRRLARGVDVVFVTDQNGQPVAGATVTAVYSGPNQGQISGITGDDGTAVLLAEWVRHPKDAWCFEVTEVAKDGYVYNSAVNMVTIQCEVE